MRRQAKGAGGATLPRVSVILWLLGATLAGAKGGPWHGAWDTFWPGQEGQARAVAADLLIELDPDEDP